jgi:putative acetyltransferase
MEDCVRYRFAETGQDYELARTLFLEYAISLSVDLSFQDFEGELTLIDRQYNSPGGALLLVYIDDDAVGCAGVRWLSEDIAELKRMYVKPGFRGRQIGLGLLSRSIEAARKIGYRKMRLDTLIGMTRAQELYRQAGFREIPSYRFNPLEGTVYMEKEL